jgi:hypothetical protein
MITEFKESSTGIGALASQISFEIYPNPATDELNLNFDMVDISPDTRVELVNSTGGVVLEMKIVQKQTKLDIQNIQPGIYVLKIFRNGDYNFRKVIIQ